MISEEVYKDLVRQLCELKEENGMLKERLSNQLTQEINTPEITEEKPKRKRRTKAEIEADEAKKNEEADA